MKEWETTTTTNTAQPNGTINTRKYRSFIIKRKEIYINNMRCCASQKVKRIPEMKESRKNGNNVDD